MDYIRRPVSDFIRDFVLGTPQGLAVLFVSAVWFLAGIIWAVSSPELPGTPVLWLGASFFMLPFLMFIYFIKYQLEKNGQPRRSVPVAIGIVMGGFFPFLYPLFVDICRDSSVLLCDSRIDRTALMLVPIGGVVFGLDSNTSSVWKSARDYVLACAVAFAAAITFGIMHGYSVVEVMIFVRMEEAKEMTMFVMTGYMYLFAALLLPLKVLFDRLSGDTRQEG